jgi:hypothetical protein
MDAGTEENDSSDGSRRCTLAAVADSTHRGEAICWKKQLTAAAEKLCV